MVGGEAICEVIVACFAWDAGRELVAAWGAGAAWKAGGELVAAWGAGGKKAWGAGGELVVAWEAGGNEAWGAAGELVAAWKPEGNEASSRTFLKARANAMKLEGTGSPSITGMGSVRSSWGTARL